MGISCASTAFPTSSHHIDLSRSFSLGINHLCSVSACESESVREKEIVCVRVCASGYVCVRFQLPRHIWPRSARQMYTYLRWCQVLMLEVVVSIQGVQCYVKTTNLNIYVSNLKGLPAELLVSRFLQNLPHLPSYH